MTQAEPIFHREFSRLGLVPAFLLAVALGFTAGQTWPQDTPQAEVQRPVPEDWHGNVRRSHWPD